MQRGFQRSKEKDFCHQGMPINKYYGGLTRMAVMDATAPFRFMNDKIITICKSNGVSSILTDVGERTFVIIASIVVMV